MTIFDLFEIRSVPQIKSVGPARGQARHKKDREQPLLKVEPLLCSCTAWIISVQACVHQMQPPAIRGHCRVAGVQQVASVRWHTKRMHRSPELMLDAAPAAAQTCSVVCLEQQLSCLPPSSSFRMFVPHMLSRTRVWHLGSCRATFRAAPGMSLASSWVWACKGQGWGVLSQSNCLFHATAQCRPLV